MYDEMPKTHFDHYRDAKSHEKNGRLEEAVSSYQKAIDTREDYAHAWYYKAQLHYRLEQYDDAICCAERALKLQPRWSDHIKNLLADCRSKC